MEIHTGHQLAQAAMDIAQNKKTLYIKGCFGAPMNPKNKLRYTQNHSYNRQADRTAMILAASEETFGFDCVCLIKGLLWGFCADKSKTYGGAVYRSNAVPDVNANTLIDLCTQVSDDFSRIAVGGVVWIPGHVGVYAGDGLVVECTPQWKNSVQITACANLGTIPNYDSRTWHKHGKLPFITYEAPTQPPLLRQNHRGQSVKLLQILLIGFGFSCGSCGADGIFGSDTTHAVRMFQEKHGLQIDGIVGSATWSALLGWEVQAWS